MRSWRLCGTLRSTWHFLLYLGPLNTPFSRCPLHLLVFYNLFIPFFFVLRRYLSQQHNRMASLASLDAQLLGKDVASLLDDLTSDFNKIESSSSIFFTYITSYINAICGTWHPKNSSHLSLSGPKFFGLSLIVCSSSSYPYGLSV